MNIGGLSYTNINMTAAYMNSPAVRPSPVGSNSGAFSGISPNIPAIPSLLPSANGNAALFFSIDGDRAEISNNLLKALETQGACHTCENRRYVDKSDDASVSYQTPTKISPNMAASAVAAHEQEHVRNEQSNAHREGRQIVSQSVTLTYDTCPECGKQYVSGGTTRTTSINKSDSDDSFEPLEIGTGSFEADASGDDE